jgi:serine protease
MNSPLSTHQHQGQGEDVVTTDYGDLYSAKGSDFEDTAVFGGTSSATPIVAGAIANFVGFWKANISPTSPPPSQIVELLVSTGTPQVNPQTGHIGEFR